MKAIVHIGLSWRGYDMPSGPTTQAIIEENQSNVEAILRGAKFENVFRPDKAFYNLEIDREDERFNPLIQGLQHYPHLASPHIRVERVFSQHEIESSAVLIWQITNQSIQDDYYELYPDRDRKVIGASYQRCGACRARITQRRDLVLNPRLMGKKDVSLTYGFDVIISERLRSILQNHSVTSFSTRPIQNYGAQEGKVPPLFQLEISHTLPPMSAPPTMFDPVRHCTGCGSTSQFLKHEHYWGSIRYYEDTDVYYPRSVLDELQDLNYSTELFGELPVAKPMILISPRLYRLLKENGVKNWSVVPVQLID